MTAIIVIGCILSYLVIGAVTLRIVVAVSEGFADEMDIDGESPAWVGFLTLVWPILAAGFICVGAVSAVGWLSHQLARISFSRTHGRKS
jgi:hypothetical protein